MRKQLALLLACAVTLTAGALDQKALRTSIDVSLSLWDAAVPYVRLGSAPALRTLDPAGILRDLAADFTMAGRYEEFAYLIEYAEAELADGHLEVRVIADRPPTPGFWPARQGVQKRAIVISEFDVDFLRGEPALYRSSFLRAVATHYYNDKEAPLNALLLGRNVLNEFSSFMTGIWTESLYLREIKHINAPTGPCPDYYNVLLGSAQDDNLKSAGSLFFGLDMDMAYEAIRKVRSIKNVDEARDLLQSLMDLPASFTAEARRIAFGAGALPYLLDRALQMRSSMLVIPWVLLSVSRAMPRNEASLETLIDSTLASLSALNAIYSYADVDYLKMRIQRLAELKMRPPEPGAPLAETDIAPSAYASMPYPGTSLSEWFRYCLPKHAFLPEGVLPIESSEAVVGSSFRFSKDKAGRLIAIEHFVEGKPRPASELSQAARITITYNGATETWRYQNQFGKPLTNEQGWSLMVASPAEDKNLIRLSFFAIDGRRVTDASGAWMVELRDEKSSGLELRYMDLSGQPYADVLGYAVDKRAFPSENVQQRSYLDERGKPSVSKSSGYHAVRLEVYEVDRTIRYSFAFSGVDGKPARYLSTYSKETIILNASYRTVSFFGDDGELVSGQLGYSREHVTMRNGLATGVTYFSPDGGRAVSEEGYSSVSGQLDEAGNQVEYAMFGIDGNPVACAEGYHQRVAEFDANGFMTQIWFYGPDSQPANNETGAARIRWSIGPDGLPYWADAWDRNGILLTGNQPGEL